MDITGIITTPGNRQITISGPKQDISIMPAIMRGTYEPHVQYLMESVIKPGFDCLDIGANLGQHTILMAKLGAYVDVIEASKTNCQYILDNITQNHSIEPHKIEIINFGLWNTDSTEELSYCEGNNGCAFFSTIGYEQGPGAALLQTKMIALDTLYPNKHFDFIKMDIEGSELKALEGGKEFFSRCPPLLVELNKFTAKSFMNYDIIELVDKIFSFGYNRVIAPNPWRAVTRQFFVEYFQKHLLIDAFFTKE